MNVTKKFDAKANMHLKPGWHSAMSQGQSISLLCRLYEQLNDEKYLIGARKALDLFDKDIVNENGVRTYFMNISSGRYPFYEEYPTQPNSVYTLNGFIYALFGLEDYASICCASEFDEACERANSFYLNGLESLLKFINLYDTGSRSFYDLRHLTVSSLSPNVARWDYHMLHISQLNYLLNHLEKKMKKRRLAEKQPAAAATSFLINEDNLEQLRSIAVRWLGYSQGIWHRNSQIKSI
jgi:heparosan-N-sulfate-glucuronate 5-epimerase